jgi:hypothetical protein
VKTWMVGECKFGILQEMSLQILYMKYVKWMHNGELICIHVQAS